MKWINGESFFPPDWKKKHLRMASNHEKINTDEWEIFGNCLRRSYQPGETQPAKEVVYIQFNQTEWLDELYVSEAVVFPGAALAENVKYDIAGRTFTWHKMKDGVIMVELNDLPPAGPPQHKGGHIGAFGDTGYLRKTPPTISGVFNRMNESDTPGNNWEPVTNLHQLTRGRIIRNKGSKRTWVVSANYGGHVTAMDTADITNPIEWEVFKND